ncbi:MAG TPA: amidohydrolase family protein [Planctomycetaceae bacterium]|nr:amidohydrolase family protein [Planctomycetaceae bacterium]
MSSTLRSWLDDWESKRGQERAFRVRWLLNPDEMPLENVKIIEQDGVVTEIRSLPASASDILPVIVTPTFVNPHTHLEFSSLRQPLTPALPFPDWIKSVIQWRRNEGIDTDPAIRLGLAESLCGGVTAIGEITTAQHIGLEDQADGCSVISFREFIGLRQDRIPELLRQAADHLSQAVESGGSNTVTFGISPHAPYTVHPELFASLVELSMERNAVVAMHLAETSDELQLLTDGTGRFANFLSELGLWDAATFPGGRSIREFLEQLAQVPKALAIHGNYFSNADIAFVAQHPNIATVYCPRTHAFFQHAPHPMPQLLAVGARVILGTDSRASNPDLSIWKELQFAATHFPDIPIPQLLAMITTHAADALGLPPDRHEIRAGAALRCVLLNADVEINDLRRLIANSSTQPLTVMK